MELKFKDGTSAEILSGYTKKETINTGKRKNIFITHIRLISKYDNTNMILEIKANSAAWDGSSAKNDFIEALEKSIEGEDFVYNNITFTRLKKEEIDLLAKKYIYIKSGLLSSVRDI